MASAPSPKKAQPARFSMAEAAQLGNFFFGCPICGLIGLSINFLKAVHVPHCTSNSAKPVDESPCPQYTDVATFDEFVDCQGNKYSSDNYGVCTQCFLILHFKPLLGLGTRRRRTRDVPPHDCVQTSHAFPFKRKWFARHIEPFVIKGHQLPNVMSLLSSPNINNSIFKKNLY